MPASSPCYADLHFHTLHSDNRDRASIEQMLLAGRERSVSVFGVGDHNHNLDRAAWRATRKEISALRLRYPSLLLMANCEITFLSGHLLVLGPRRIRGTIAEGYRFLYRDRRLLKILAHPHPGSDEWHQRLVPGAAGIEVINGSVFRKARAGGLTLSSVLDIPLVRLYARYLGLGLPVAAMGNSDAHELDEMGSGLTGLWLDPPLTAGKLSRAIRRRRTFATSDPGIRLHWREDSGGEVFSWQVCWEPFDPQAAGRFRVEVYRGEQLLETGRAEGSIRSEEGGLFWVAAYNGWALAVSSPLRLPDRGGKRPRAAVALPAELVRKPLTDLVQLHRRRRRRLELSPASRGGQAETILLAREERPRVIDAAGVEVPCTVLEPLRQRVVIDKGCASPCFEEFFLWLKRNEIHEYGFLDFDYRLEGGLFQLQATMVPARMVLIDDFSTWYREEIGRIRDLISPSTRFRIDVRVLFAGRVRLELDGHPFPFRLEGEDRVKSILIWSEREPSRRDLRRFLGNQALKLPEGGAAERILQYFLPAGEPTSPSRQRRGSSLG